MTRQEAYVAELNQLLFYMTAWDKAEAIRKVSSMFEQAENEAELLEELGSPMKLAVKLHREYEPTPEPTAEQLAAAAARAAEAAAAAEEAEEAAEEAAEEIPAVEEEPAEEAVEEVPAEEPEAAAEEVPVEKVPAVEEVPVEAPAAEEAAEEAPAAEAPAEAPAPEAEEDNPFVFHRLDVQEAPAEEVVEAPAEETEAAEEAAEEVPVAEEATEEEAEEPAAEAEEEEPAEEEVPARLLTNEDEAEKERIFVEIFNAATEAQSAVPVEDLSAAPETVRKARYWFLIPYTALAVILGVPMTLVFALANLTVFGTTAVSLCMVLFLVVFHLGAAVGLGSQLIVIGLILLMVGVTICLGVMTVWFLRTATAGFPKFLVEVARNYGYREVTAQ